MRRWAPFASVVYLAMSLMPRAMIFSHHHADGDHEHTHAWGVDADDGHDHDDDHDDHHHDHDHEHARDHHDHPDDGQAELEDDDHEHGAHLHAQAPFQLASTPPVYALVVRVLAHELNRAEARPSGVLPTPRGAARAPPRSITA